MGRIRNGLRGFGLPSLFRLRAFVSLISQSRPGRLFISPEAAGETENEMDFTLIGKISYYAVFCLLLLFMIQKRYGERGVKKRLATLYLSFAVLAVYAASLLHSIPNVLPWAVWTALFTGTFIAATAFCIMKRKKIFLASFRCVSCGAKLPLERAFFIDSNLCKTCEKQADGSGI